MLESSYRLLFEDNPQPIWVYDRETLDFLAANDAASAALGYSRDALLRMNVVQICPLEDRPGIAEQIAQLPAELTQPRVWRLLRADGEFFEAEIVSHQVAFNGRAGRLVQASDITARRTAERALAASEAYFRSLIEKASDLITILDANGVIRYESPSVARILGYHPDELCGRPAVELIHPADQPKIAQVLAERLKEPGSDIITRFRFRHADGSWRVLESLGRNAVDDPAIRGIVVNSRDITEATENQRRMEEYSRELERSNRELQEFAHVASHDLQEPLRKIRAFGDRLRGQFAEILGEQGADYVERMQAAAARMQSLIQDLLAYSRIGAQARELAEVDLSQLADEVLSDLQGRIQSTAGEVAVEPLPTIRGDPTQLRQLLQNLLGNALKFHRAGVPPRVRLWAETEGDTETRLYVRDEGIGFDEKYCDRIFAPFQRLHGREEYEGTGMGLAICRKIVERHRGALTATSQPGKGTTFRVTLPTGPADPRNPS